MPYQVVCISRDVGAGGEEIGRSLAERLAYRHVDEEILERAAENSGMQLDAVAGAEERRTLASRLLDAIGNSAIAMPEAMAWAPDAVLAAVPHENLREVIREAVRQTADEGRVVIVAHAASYVLAGRTDMLRVLVTGSPDDCAGRLMELGGLDEKTARRDVDEGRAARADYLRRFHGVREELPVHYDVVVNTDHVSLEQAVAALAALTTAG